MSELAATLHRTIDIGGMPILLRTESPEFARILEHRYAGFVSHSPAPPDFSLDVHIAPPRTSSPDADVEVHIDGPRWIMQRGDFRAEWDPARRSGWVRQTANPYSIDAVLRILHSLILARQDGFLLHAASAVRNGRAFLFSGISGAGKTTISRLAPPDATLLTDEISYLRKQDGHYFAYGTPFAGELGIPGEKIRAPLAALYLLAKGPENRIDDLPRGDAARALMRNVLFFAHDRDLVNRVFASILDFVHQVPVRRLTFVPDMRVWELIQ